MIVLAGCVVHVTGVDVQLGDGLDASEVHLIESLQNSLLLYNFGKGL